MKQILKPNTTANTVSSLKSYLDNFHVDAPVRVIIETELNIHPDDLDVSIKVEPVGSADQEQPKENEPMSTEKHVLSTFNKMSENFLSALGSFIIVNAATNDRLRSWRSLSTAFAEVSSALEDIAIELESNIDDGVQCKDGD